MDIRTELHSLFARGIELLGLLESTSSPRQPKQEEASATPRIEPEPTADEPLIVRPLSRAFAMVGVAKTRGYEMLNEGTLERVKLGKRASGVTMRSIRRVLEGLGK